MVDTILVSPVLASIPRIRSRDAACLRPGEMFEDMREKLRNALLKLELREEDVARPTTRSTPISKAN